MPWLEAGSQKPDFNNVPKCHKCGGAKFNFGKDEWHENNKGTTPSTTRKPRETEAPCRADGGRNAVAKAKPKAKAKAGAQAAPRPVGLQGHDQETQPKTPGPQGPAGATSQQNQLQGRNITVDQARAARDPVYSSQLPVDLLVSMNVREDHPRRVDAERRLQQATAEREATMPPAEKAAKLRDKVQSPTRELTTVTSQRLAQEAQHKELCEQLNKSQADTKRLESALTAAQDALRAQEALRR